jgi:hypothetical protein
METKQPARPLNIAMGEGTKKGNIFAKMKEIA